MEFGGLSDTLKYYEFELDSLDTVLSGGPATSIDWPVFHIGGKRPLQNIAAIKVLEVQIPFSWYVFTAPTNTFVLQEDGQADVIVTIPEGNYTAGEMVIVLGQVLTAVSLNGSTYTASYSTVTQKITYYNNEVATKPFSFLMPIVSGTGIDNPRLALGLPAGTTSSQTFVPGGPPDRGNTLVSPNVFSLTGPNYLYLNSVKLGNLTNIYLPTGAVDMGGGNSGPQLAKVAVTVQPGGVIFWSDPDPGKWFDLENLAGLTSVDFYLTLGNQNRVLKLNGQPFSVKLGIVEKDLQVTDYSQGGFDHVVKRIRQQ